MSRCAYNFITTWKIKAPLQHVWQLVHDNEDWPNWWKGVLKSETIEKGDENEFGKIVDFCWKSVLPYKVNFCIISRFVEPPFILEGVAHGDAIGTGKWWLEEQEGITTVQCIWSVNMNKIWMNKLSLILKPLFLWNHRVIMSWGAKGLATQLNCELTSESTQFYRRK